MAQSVGASSYTPKGCGFNPQSGHIPGLWVRSLVRAHKWGTWSMFLPLLSHPPLPHSVSFSLCPPPPSLPPALKSVNIPWVRIFFFHPMSMSQREVTLGHCYNVTYTNVSASFLFWLDHNHFLLHQAIARELRIRSRGSVRTAFSCTCTYINITSLYFFEGFFLDVSILQRLD